MAWTSQFNRKIGGENGMNTFSKIYKKISNDKYNLAGEVGVNNQYLNVFQSIENSDESMPRVGYAGLLPTPLKGENNSIFSFDERWIDFYLNGFAETQDKSSSFKISTTLNKNIEIPIDNMITKKDYSKISNLAGGFKIPSSNNNEYTFDDEVVGPVGQYYDSNIITSNGNYQDILCTKRDDDEITYSNMKPQREIGTSGKSNINNKLDYDWFLLGSTNADGNDGVKIAPYNTPKIVSITCRFAVNSGTIGNSVEICPFVNGSRSAAQSITHLSGGNWYETIIKTYIFYVPVCTDKTNLSDATNIIFKTKALKGNPKVCMNDMIVSFLNMPGMYWLTNKENYSITRLV